MLADIFLGKIKTWNDSAIKSLNPGVNLPSNPITTVHRADGSGTTYIFTNYLSTVSPAWTSGPGTGKSVSWPIGVAGQGNEGVAGLIKTTPYSIGYVELAYALQNHFTYAKIQNAAGKFVSPSLKSVAADAAQKPNITAVDFSIVDQPGADQLPDLRLQLGARLPAPEERTTGHDLGERARLADPCPARHMAATLDYVPLPANIQRWPAPRCSR